MMENNEDVNYLSKEDIDEFYGDEFKSIKLDKVSFSYLDKENQISISIIFTDFNA